MNRSAYPLMFTNVHNELEHCVTSNLHRLLRSVSVHPSPNYLASFSSIRSQAISLLPVCLFRITMIIEVFLLVVLVGALLYRCIISFGPEAQKFI